MGRTLRETGANILSALHSSEYGPSRVRIDTARRAAIIQIDVRS